jgi:DNA-binding NtrC family response regulator
VLKAAGGQKSTAAEVLGVSRPRLDRLIDKYGLSELAPGRRKVDAGGGDGEDRP